MLTVQDLSFGYHKTTKVLEHFNLTVESGELLALMGPSGCGKSTLLRLIAGFLKPDGGLIQSDFEKISFVFQEPRLFPWLTVSENLKAVHPNATQDQINDFLALVELREAEALYPDELSGGMKSRVSLARGLLYGGDLMLLDEPFSALDRELRLTLAASLRARLKASHCTAILVTHQEEDAKIFADRIVSLSPVV